MIDLFPFHFFSAPQRPADGKLLRSSLAARRLRARSDVPGSVARPTLRSASLTHWVAGSLFLGGYQGPTATDIALATVLGIVDGVGKSPIFTRRITLATEVVKTIFRGRAQGPFPRATGRLGGNGLVLGP